MTENMTDLEALYQNATFDYLDNDNTTDTTDYAEALETTEDFLVNLDYNFYQTR
ncbi:hypothetical protein JTZ62_05085 [Mammaliicoccus sciuri]|uniref:hypothetical protein n=1 Tax=Mammaliicoccus sciuri TaxID=1296 RepID=UPI0019D3359E|nr:hypothetical protein [Mammaliicoccus sciuri]QSN69085.1 hypothetical protein JTZ62_05085 [Mammaliicoccus sciuri]UIU23276.1 hypothetical protein LLZ87_05100 [Mammaliicoccus sciuri]UIU26182.1 hypothetical protein LLZ92_05100 [Mammaliicoccus sciuri]